MKPVDEIPVFGEILVLKYCENSGAAFSMFENNKFILIGVTSVALLIGVLAILSSKVQGKTLNYSIAVVVAGGIANLIDRIFLGYVVDYIYIKIINFAIFNFADICITLGGIVMVIAVVFFDKDKNDAKV